MTVLHLKWSVHMSSGLAEVGEATQVTVLMESRASQQFTPQGSQRCCLLYGSKRAGNEA